ncbi:MAG TPA: hypothetical protein VN363_03460, partial [Anaerolineales bacterium]|nr:hypothetical protein [Anaerolineales bacterium]
MNPSSRLSVLSACLILLLGFLLVGQLPALGQAGDVTGTPVPLTPLDPSPIPGSPTPTLTAMPDLPGSPTHTPDQFPEITATPEPPTLTATLEITATRVSPELPTGTAEFS